jgi:DNA-binding CsgD family transcriptional regulator
MRHAIRQDELGAFLQALHGHDVTADLQRVQAPTLVLGREDAAAYTVPVVSEVAAGIANARLVVLPGNWMLPCTDDDTSREIIDFMTDGADVGAAPDPPANNGEAPELHNGASALSPREREVLALLSLGKTNAEIAQRLVVAPATASRHVHNILQKLGMNRRAEAAVYAARAGLVPEGTVR